MGPHKNNDIKVNVYYKKQCCNRPSSSLSFQNSKIQLHQSSKLTKKVSNLLNISWSRSKMPLNLQKTTNLIRKEPKLKIKGFFYNIKNWLGETKNPSINTSTIIEPSITHEPSSCKSWSLYNDCSTNSQASRRRHNNIPKPPYRHSKYNSNPTSSQRCTNHDFHMEKCKSRFVLI